MTAISIEVAGALQGSEWGMGRRQIPGSSSSELTSLKSLWKKTPEGQGEMFPREAMLIFGGEKR